MKLKSACLAWFGLFLFMAVLIGALVYRRMGVVEPALVAGFIGGGLAWVGEGRESLARTWLGAAQSPPDSQS